MNERAILAVLVCLPLLSGRACGMPEGDRDAKVQTGDETFVVTGDVHYKERILLPQGASLRVFAEDGEATLPLAEWSRSIAGSPPYAFTLSIDEALVNDPKSVTVHAEIIVDGARLFASEEPVAAFSGGRPREDVEILVRVVSSTD